MRIPQATINPIRHIKHRITQEKGDPNHDSSSLVLMRLNS